MSDVFFSDLLAVSPGGHFTLRAQSPENGEVPRPDGTMVDTTHPHFQDRAMQGGFRYRLTDNRTGKTVWERWQEPNEGSPVEVILSDDAWAVFRTHSFQPLVGVISPAGEVVLRVRVLPGRMYKRYPQVATDPEVWLEDHAVETSAGVYWADNSWRYFFRYKGTRYFAWRPYWGRRLVFDLDRVRRLSDEEAGEEGLLLAMIEEEATWAIRHLSEAAGRVSELQELLSDSQRGRREPNPLWDHLRFLMPAAHLSGVHRIRKCIPLLERLEGLSFIRSWGSCRVLGKGWSLETELYRPVVQHALRRLGQTPRGFAPYYFASRDGRRLPALESLTDRDIRFQELRPGMTPVEVLERVGAPDEHHDGHPDWDDRKGEWDYDFLGEAGWVTRRLSWSSAEEGCRLQEVREAPADWLTDTRREFAALRL